MRFLTALLLVRRSAAQQLLIALACVAIAANVRVLLGSVLPLNAGWQPFSFAILLAAMTGGTLGGTTALVGSVIAGDYLYTQPVHTLRIASAAEAISVLMFATVGAGITFFGVRLRRFVQEADDRAAALREAARNERDLRDRLHAQAEHLRIVLDTAPLALWVARDPQCRVIEGNRAANELFGVPRDERVVAYRHVRDGGDIPEDDLPMKRAVRTGAPVAADEIEVEFAGGVRRVMLMNAVPLRAEDGSVRGAVGSAVDVTELLRAVQALEESDRRLAAQRDELQTILDVVPIGIGITYDPRANDIRANRQFAKLLRIRPDQNASLTGPGRAALPFRCERDGVEIPGEELPMQVAARTGKAVYGACFDLVFDDGTVRNIIMNAAPFLTPHGGVRGSVAALVDVTQERATERALRDSEERFRALVMASSDVVYRTSADWSRISFFDGHAFSDDGGEPTRTCVENYLHPDDHARVYAAIDAAIRTKGVFQIEHRVVGGPGGVGWTLSRAIPIRDARGEITEWFGAASDITERKAAEDALRQADRRKDEFLAMLAHELRNPLAPIRTSVEVLRRLAPKEEPLVRARDMIERQVTHMTRLVDDLLDVSRITRGKIELKHAVVSLREVVEEAVEGARPWIVQHGHSLSVRLAPEPLLVSADRARLVQVIGNLLANAAKFTPHAGHVTVSARATERDEAVVAVRDTGIGIPRELQEGIFDLFRQEETSLARSQGGLGIGLTLVKRLVELHGGSVAVRSEGRGTGSEFVVTIPLADVSSARSVAASPQRPEPVAAVRVLVVEDNADAAESLKMLLELAGHDVRVVGSGLQALRIVDQFEPHIAFIDLGLPEMNGFDVARRLRADPRMQDSVLVALTGYGTDEDRIAARAAGFDRHLVKPVEGEAILDLIADLVLRAPRSGRAPARTLH